INEALELALAAIDKEALPELQQPQQQPENLFPITVPFNNNDASTFADTSTNNINNNDEQSSKEILKETEIELENQQLEPEQQILPQNGGFLINKTDEKCENLKLEDKFHHV
ncbi:hypothetical protein EVAR_101508_1, partial [Eumeta japonica]